MTSNKEDYLKVIYEEGGLEQSVKNKRISEKLGIAPASVSEMLTKLDGQGFITYKAYKGSRLTSEGLSACLEVVRSHRIWEVFLIRCLGYTWREAHEDAHSLEHAASERMIDRLDAFLNYPKACPHGARIPQGGEPSDTVRMRRLSDLSKGDKAVVCRVLEDGKLLDYLERNGLEINKTIQVLSIDDYEGPVTFIQEGKTISISFKAAAQVYVECPDNMTGGLEHGV